MSGSLWYRQATRVLFIACRIVLPISLLFPARSAAQTSQGARLLRYATYLGGSGGDAVTDLAIAPDGTVYVVGGTSSRDFPVSPAAVQREHRGPASAFIGRFSPDGAELLAATLLGGTSNTAASAVAIDEQGNVYVTGATGVFGDTPSGFPTTPGAHRTISGEGFVAKLSPNLDRFIYSTLIQTASADLAVDRDGNAYLTGMAFSDFVTTPGVFQPQNGGGLCYPGRTRGSPFPCPDAWVAKLNPAGSALVFATRLGGRGEERALSLTVDASGNAWASGETASPDFPTTTDALDRGFHGRRELDPLWYGDSFVAKLSSDGRRLLYATYLGGTEADIASHVQLDGFGNIYVAGITQSRDFPVTAGSAQTSYGGPLGLFPPASVGDGFVVKLAPGGSLAWGTYLGGSGADGITRLALSREGSVYAGSSSESPDFPVTPGTIPKCPAGERGLYVSVFSPEGGRLERSTRLGGLGLDQISGFATDTRSGLLFVSGLTRSLSFFATAGAFQPSYQGGDSDGFVAQLDLERQVDIFVSCIVHAATLRPGGHPFFPNGTVSPGQLITLFGVGLGPQTGVIAQAGPDGRVPTGLAGTRILFDGRPGSLLYVSDRQVNAVTPFALGEKTTLEIERNETRIGLNVLPVVPAAPGIFTLDASGRGLAAALNQDGSVNSPSNPAERGSIIVFYASGLGLLHPPLPDGQLAPVRLPLPIPRLGVRVLISAKPAEILYAGQAPGLVAGVIQINARIPEDIPPSNSTFLDLWAGDYQNLQLSGGVTLAVR